MSDRWSGGTIYSVTMIAVACISVCVGLIVQGYAIERMETKTQELENRVVPLSNTVLELTELRARVQRLEDAQPKSKQNTKKLLNAIFIGCNEDFDKCTGGKTLIPKYTCNTMTGVCVVNK